MYTKSILLASLAAASAVSAKQLYPGHNHVRRDIAARQTAASTTADFADSTAVPSEFACLTDLASVYGSLPSEPAALESYFVTASVTDPCAFSLPASISSIAKSYGSELEAWYRANSAAIASVMSECPTYSSLASASDFDDTYSGTFSDQCTTITEAGHGGGASATAKTTGATTTAKTTGTTATTGTGTGTGTATAGSSTTTTSANAGPRETGMVGLAALAMVGVLGVVAAL
ncbi:hypothetical protein SEPCBS119000_005390 [Sporothrix epigloea]|uniref:Infection structure specific protein n=1 Tax=Sporothrix epigloea TaxID=1892477 RepID=A0ABP0E178_9PEZI